MIIVIVLIAATWFMLIPRTEAGAQATVEIYIDGELIEQLPLCEDSSFHVNGNYTNTVTISGGEVSITASDCPGGDCLHSGAIDSPGRSIVCLPNRVEVRINGAPAKDEVDFVVG
ncbi:MAG: NusG domain II-containing protein [Clostridia bacterium]|nr:NusG domain II-containing protein [Clostridia bacterium]